jgi:hypothetical protein
MLLQDSDFDMLLSRLSRFANRVLGDSALSVQLDQSAEIAPGRN